MIKFNKEDVVIVTGGSSGIGRQTVIRLNELGASVIVTGRSLEELDATRKLCKNPENIFLEPKELTENVSELPDWIKGLKDKYGKLFGLICCAGISLDDPLQLLDETAARRMFDINYFVPIFLSKGFADKRVSVKGRASITYVTSIAAHLGDKSQSVYGATKAALIASAKSFSRELAPNVRVNCVSPGIVQTPMYDKVLAQYGNYKSLEKMPLGIGKVEDVADLLVYLTSDNARWITGQNYVLDGGYF